MSEQISKDKSILLCRSHLSPSARNMPVSMAACIRRLKRIAHYGCLSRKKPLTLVSKKLGYPHPAHQLMPKARASHQPLFTFYISILELRGV